MECYCEMPFELAVVCHTASPIHTLSSCQNAQYLKNNMSAIIHNVTGSVASACVSHDVVSL